MALFEMDQAALETYRPVVDEPADFDGFWARTLAELPDDPAVRLERVDNKLAVVDSYDLTFSGFGGARINGWLHLPRGATEPLPAVVQYHGYSGGRGFPFQGNEWAVAGYAHLTMDTRGQGWAQGGDSVTADGSADGGDVHAPGFMTAGITDPDRYYYRRVFADAIQLLRVAGRLPQIDPDQLVVTGRSQGGGITLATAGLAPSLGIRLIGAAPDVPFLCHFQRALAVSDQDPYAEISRYLAGWRDRVEAAYRTLSYVDGVNMARRAEAPTLFSVALMDGICPPSTVYAAYHAYGERVAGERPEKEMAVYRFNGHEGGEAYQFGRQLDWVAGLLSNA